ncbi:MAG: hypothetical protein JJE52_01350 [Acidimicrobiia bacterium]|nr:hypothetical protein [Acidimicrobiia bacterium]
MVRAGAPEPELPSSTVEFMHNSEHQLARLFDFYGIVWEYEPRTFVLAVDADGMTTEAFTPDFYLPDHGRYLEVTTLQQPLVTRKNRKVRKLRGLHPDIDIRVVYQRDYLHLLVRYGLDAPSQLEVAEVVATASEPDIGLLGLRPALPWHPSMPGFRRAS